MLANRLLPFNWLPAVIALSLVGCPGPKDDTEEESGAESADVDSYPTPVDADSDGITVADGDCDDNDANLYPGRAEDCDGLDNNCNEVVDEGLADADTDGTADCMDVEECDGVDNDGDAEIDEGFSDSDGDGNADCVGTEICDGLDNNGDGRVDEGFDADGDGATQCGSSSEAADCDDSDASISPGATENTSDLIDNDCDGLIDEGEWAEGDLTITEILVNPGQVSDPDGEWFEIYNLSDRDIILNGVIIASGTEEHQIADDNLIIVEPGDFIVLGTNDDMGSNGEVEVSYVYEGISLSNESDDLSIAADSLVIDTVMWDDGATMPDPDGASMGMDLGNYDPDLNDDGNWWCAATLRWTSDPTADKGSPGEGNEYCSTTDHDGDGFNGDEGDCNDGDATVYPGAWEELTGSVDNDCDGIIETAPVAVSAATSDGYSCNDIALSSAGSYDIEGAPLTYSWELTSAPSASTRTTADIDTPTSANPTFNPDEAGTYTFALTVNDGGADSLPATVSVTVSTRGSNSDPVAYAGADQSSSQTVTCSSSSYGTVWTCDDCDSYDFTLSGTGSTDADSDVLTYAWTITSGSTYGSLSASTGSSVTLTTSGITATYGTANQQDVDVQLDVTDCMGATSTDSVRVSFTCTGS